MWRLARKMSEYGSDDGANCSIKGSEVNGPQASDRFRNLSGVLRVQVYIGNSGELKNWTTETEKKHLIYKLSEAVTALLAYDVAEGLVLEFIGSFLARSPG